MDKTLKFKNKNALNAKAFLVYTYRGFSLIETLVALTIFALVFLAISNFIVTNFNSAAFNEQQNIVLRASQSLLAEAQAVEDAQIYANYNGSCKNSSSAVIKDWCENFYPSNAVDKPIKFYNLNIITSYTSLANTENLKQFKLQIRWHSQPKDTQYRQIQRIIYITDK